MQWRIGHRGASGTYPENTMLAFRKAIELGANALECDVHLCKTGEAVVIHDRTLNRTTNGNGLVSRCSLKELKTLDAGNGERIPTLEEVLTEFTPAETVFIELKTKTAIKAAVDTIRHIAEDNAIPYEHMPVISFQLSYLESAKEFNHHILTGYTPPENKTDSWLSHIKLAADTGMWSVNPSIKYLEQKHVEAAHAAGLKVITWTANTEKDIKKIYALGVDGVMSDWPEKLTL